VTKLKKFVEEYCYWLEASNEGFETDIAEIVLWAVYREDIGKNVDFLSEEERLKVIEADEVAKKLAREKKGTEAGIGFEQIVKVIEQYPVQETVKPSA
jgi:hypothetical protein